MPPPLILEPVAASRPARDLALVTAGLGLGAAAVAATFLLLPRGSGILLLLVLAFPVARTVRNLRRARGTRAPVLRLDPEGISLGALRYRWRDVRQVEAGPLVRTDGRTVPERVKLRLNALAPIRPTGATLSALGLEPGDGYFDLALPPAYGLTAAELADRVETFRTAGL